MDHRRALRAAIWGPPADWKRPRGRQRQTWTRTVENDLKPANIGLHTAWRRTQDHADWRNSCVDSNAPLGTCYWWWLMMIDEDEVTALQQKIANKPVELFTFAGWNNRRSRNVHHQTVNIELSGQLHEILQCAYQHRLTSATTAA